MTSDFGFRAALTTCSGTPSNSCAGKLLGKTENTPHVTRIAISITDLRARDIDISQIIDDFPFAVPLTCDRVRLRSYFILLVTHYDRDVLFLCCGPFHWPWGKESNGFVVECSVRLRMILAILPANDRTGKLGGVRRVAQVSADSIDCTLVFMRDIHWRCPASRGVRLLRNSELLLQVVLG